MNFCTLFDSYYIHKGIATYISLEKVTDDFHLYIMAFDRDCYNKLKSLGFKNMTIEFLDDFETPELLNVKPTRNKAEYCWTCGPSVIWHFMHRYNLHDITYIDADLFFISSPQILIDEIGGASIGLTEHNNVDPSISGRFCVQFNYFKNDKVGNAALEWWRDSCIDWCYSRYEDGKFGDQRYLDSVPDKFPNVHIIKNRGAGIASWNFARYKYFDRNLEFNGVSDPFVFYHMHGVKTDIVDDKLIIYSVNAYLSQQVLTLFYEPYAHLLIDVFNNYLSRNISSFKIVNRPYWEELYEKARRPFRHYRLLQWVYYKLLNHRYFGLESKKI